jgi:hypothetical protein
MRGNATFKNLKEYLTRGSLRASYVLVRMDTNTEGTTGRGLLELINLYVTCSSLTETLNDCKDPMLYIIWLRYTMIFRSEIKVIHVYRVYIVVENIK